MTKGVHVNGREYQQGDHIEHYTYVPPRHGAARVGGNPPVGNTESSRLGTINMFYTFAYGSQPRTFLEITLLPIVERLSPALFVVKSIDRSESRLDGFQRIPNGETTMVFIDSVVFRINLVPHFTNTSLLCTIRMWEAR